MARQADPRPCVIVAPSEGKTLVSWGTPKVEAALEAAAWPRVSRARTERQEHSFTRRIDHGALPTNYGRKKIVGPDRQQQRAREKRAQALEGAQRQMAHKAQLPHAPQAKGAESPQQGHPIRLQQRQRAWVGLAQACKDAQQQHETLWAHAHALGPPQERADRDFRQQTILTFRTLWLENALTSCMAMLLGHLTMQGSLACLWRLLFARSGARMETDSHVMYWVHTTGLSMASQRLLTAGVDGLCAMDLRSQGKPIPVRLHALSP